MDVLLSTLLFICMHISHHQCLDIQSMYRVYKVEWLVCLLFTSIIPLMHIHHPIQIFSLGNSRTVPSSQLSDPDMDAEEVRRPTGDELIYVQL